MNNLTVVDRGGVKHPEIVTIDEAQNLLDRYGIGGTAVEIPSGVNLQKYLGRCDGGWYFDDASVSGSTGGPAQEMIYYTVISAGEPGNRVVIASNHKNELWLGHVYGDVFRGWVPFASKAEVHLWIENAIDLHEKSRRHPEATETEQGMVQYSNDAESIDATVTNRGLNPRGGQTLLNSYGIGVSVTVPDGSDLAIFWNDKRPGFYRVNEPVASGYSNYPTDVPFSWAEVISSNRGPNTRALYFMTNIGRLYTGSVTSGVFSGWKLKLQMEDLPIASLTQRGIVQLTDSVSSTSVTTAATPNSVKSANDNANTRVPMVRTINGYALNQNLVLTANDVNAWSKEEADARYLFRTDSSIPPGTPTPWGKPTAPDGYLIAQGQRIPDECVKLRAVYGEFLPDLRGVVIRGLDLGRGLDSGRTVLSYQSDAQQVVTAQFPCVDDYAWSVSNPLYRGAAASTIRYAFHYKYDGRGATASIVSFDSSRVARTAAETRMANVAFTYVVKAE